MIKHVVCFKLNDSSETSKNEVKEMLLSMGADAAMMTGSGSAVFGLFQDRARAIACEKALHEKGMEAYFCTLL